MLVREDVKRVRAAMESLEGISRCDLPHATLSAAEGLRLLLSEFLPVGSVPASRSGERASRSKQHVPHLQVVPDPSESPKG